MASPAETGYHDCSCRDCFGIYVGTPGKLCLECDEAGCQPGHECLAPGAYGAGEDLRASGIHYFKDPAEAGADYAEITEATAEQAAQFQETDE